MKKHTVHITTDDGEYTHLTTLYCYSAIELVNGSSIKAGSMVVEFDHAIKEISIDKKQIWPAVHEKKKPAAKTKKAPVERIYINIGLNCTVRDENGRKVFIQHRNIPKVVFNVEPGKGLSLKRVQAYVESYYPGWSLTGYAVADNDNTK